MSKGHRSSHNENAATAWRQHNADWWSEMKRKNKSEKMRTVANKATENDDEAAGRLHPMELHHIIAAAVEGHNNKKQVAYCALRKNYSSLMCSSTLKTDIHEETVSSPIFIQHTFIHDAKEVPHTISLTEMRAAIHKLQPEDLEQPIVENPTSTIGTNGPNKNPLENLAHISIQSCTSQIYQEILTIIHTPFSKEQYE